MNKTQAERVVKREFPRYQKLLHLHDWKFTFRYKWIGDEDDLEYGNCTADPSYRSAVIVLNPNLHENESQLANTLRHELFHVFHSSFDMYRDMVEKLIDKREFDALDTAYDFSAEVAVLMLEGMFDKELKIPLVKGKK